MGLCSSSKDQSKPSNMINNQPKEQLNNISSAISSKNNTCLSPSHSTDLFFRNIQKYYNIGKVINSGTFGKVRTCQKKWDNTNKIFAVKSIPKNQCESDILNEIKALINLDHPNIMKFYEYYVDDLHYHLVTEFCSGGDLIDKFNKKHPIEESKAARIIWKLLSAVAYCHSKGVVHRDIKPENILLENEEAFENCEIKLIDFNFSATLKKDQNLLSTTLGTPYYMAPEVIIGCYDELCDIWSIGIVAYFILCGNPPFYDSNNNLVDIYNMILNKDPSFSEEIWENISEDGKDFIRQCLNKDPSKRPTAKKLFDHNWFAEARSLKSKAIGTKIWEFKSKLSNLRHFAYPQKLNKLFLKCILDNVMTSHETKELKRIFNFLDLANTGYIGIDELAFGFQQAKISISTQELKAIISQCSIKDPTASTLEYSDFILGIFDIENYLNKIILKNVFDVFDFDNSNTICAEDLLKYFIRTGDFNKSITESSQLIKEVANGKEELGFEQMLKNFC